MYPSRAAFGHNKKDELLMTTETYAMKNVYSIVSVFDVRWQFLSQRKHHVVYETGIKLGRAIAGRNNWPSGTKEFERWAKI